jgi:hypothetical protein
MLPESPGHSGSLAPFAIIDNLPHDLCGKVAYGNGEYVGFYPRSMFFAPMAVFMARGFLG